MNMQKILLTIVAALVLAACSGAPAVVGSRAGGAPEGEAHLSKRLDELGYSDKTEIKRLSNYRLNGWSYVDKYHVIINSGPSKNHLIQFKRACYDLRHADTIGFKTSMGSVARGDRMIVRSMGDNVGDCWIDAIYQLTRKPKDSEQ
jgi:hypothetical protein